MSFECGVGDCKSSYTTTTSLRQHQRKKHATEYAVNSLMIRSQKKLRVEEPLPSDLAPKATFVETKQLTQETCHETCQVTIANTRLHVDEQIDQLKSNLGELHSVMLAQITDLQQRVKMLAKQTTKWCVFCYERENDYAFLPCGHKCMCEPCAKATATKGAQICPLCRTKITKIQRIYDTSALV